jgi:hypothetical protein
MKNRVLKYTTRQSNKNRSCGNLVATRTGQLRCYNLVVFLLQQEYHKVTTRWSQKVGATEGATKFYRFYIRTQIYERVLF